jgi:hypothetical protein
VKLGKRRRRDVALQFTIEISNERAGLFSKQAGLPRTIYAAFQHVLPVRRMDIA